MAPGSVPVWLPRHASLACLALFFACGGPEPAADAHFVTSAVCAGCHPDEQRAWSGSHHDRAMQEAVAETVLGDFEDASFRHFGVTTRFFRDGERFFVRTPGADGTPTDFEVRYTFGVEPLQQYLVELPGGRLQGLTVAWDSRPRSAGGQRWFSLHPDEKILPGDVLHWTGPAQSWNAMCADCHSTNLQKGYRAAEQRYETTWSDVDVGCEACHGPGSKHVDWAEAGTAGGAQGGGGRSGLVVDLRSDAASWSPDPTTGLPRRSHPRESRAEIETCAPCHARRSAIREPASPGGALLDEYMPALLEEGLYTADGQMHDEVYVYGSFLQSRMYRAGVTCSDCHEPHSLALRADPDPVCAGCHSPARFATPAHHHHPPESAGASCVGCHMPVRTYMVLDERHDHSFRVPRPDLTLELGTPNACTDCHGDRDAAWAAGQLASGSDGDPAARPHFGRALAAARRGAPGAARELRRLAANRRAPGIARATAVELLARSAETSRALLERSARDEDPLVRLAVARAAAGLPPERRLSLLAPLLEDPLRAVRIEAAWGLADAPGAPESLVAALAEYRDAQRANADRPQSHVNLGLLHARRGELEAAEASYEQALAVGPYFVPAYVNLADLYRMQGRDDEGERVLRRGLAAAAGNAELHHALGLLQVRARQLPAALDSLGRARELAPEQVRYAYVYAIALHSAGRVDDALRVLEEARQQAPQSPELLRALATISRDSGRRAQALRWTRALAEIVPGDPGVQALLRDLENGG